MLGDLVDLERSEAWNSSMLEVLCDSDVDCILALPADGEVSYDLLELSQSSLEPCYWAGLTKVSECLLSSRKCTVSPSTS